MSEKTLMRPSRSLTMDSISPEDLPRQGERLLFYVVICFSLIGLLLTPPLCCVSVEFLEAVRQQVQKFQVQYIGNLPVSRAMGKRELHL